MENLHCTYNINIADKIKVQSTAYWNNDGLDVTDSKHVKITNCFINASDDALCFKSEDLTSGGCDDIIVDNVRKNYKVKDRDIIDLGFNKHNIKTVVLDYKGTQYNITDDIKSILHNYIIIA